RPIDDGRRWAGASPAESRAAPSGYGLPEGVRRTGPPFPVRSAQGAGLRHKEEWRGRGWPPRHREAQVMGHPQRPGMALRSSSVGQSTLRVGEEDTNMSSTFSERGRGAAFAFRRGVLRVAGYAVALA